jgi:uncharacterized protein (TIGR03437 family)
LDTDVPSHDLSLLTRFDQDFVVQQGTVGTPDFFSQTPGSGREQFEITPASVPPLQTGTYFFALGVLTPNTPITGSLTATVEAGGPPQIHLVSLFDHTPEGWARSSGDPQVSMQVVNPGSRTGYLSFTDPKTVGARDFIVAPPKFLGNFAFLVNPRIEFQYQNLLGSEPTQDLLFRLIAGGVTFDVPLPRPPRGAWGRYSIPLASLRLPGRSVDLAHPFANVQTIQISMDQSPGPNTESNAIDNFILTADGPPPAPTSTPQVPVRSTFVNETEGWGRSYPPSGVPGASLGDSRGTLVRRLDRLSPTGTSAVYTSRAGSFGDAFVAPAGFLGNLAAIANPTLEFDMKHTSQPFAPGPVAVRLLGAGSVYRWTGRRPFIPGGLVHSEVPLAPSYFVRELGTAPFAQVLASVERLEISADLTREAETNTLYSVALLSGPPPPPLPAASAAPEALTFRAGVDTLNPSPQTFTVRSEADPKGGLSWSAAVEPSGSWIQLSAMSGTTPSTVAVTIVSADLTPGDYIGVISIHVNEALNPSIELRVTLTVAPATPRINSGSIGNAATFSGPLAPGSLASLFGLNLGPAAGASATFLPGTQTLPTSFQGVRVLVRDSTGNQIAEAPLLYVSNRQINFQVPYEVAGRSSIVLVVENEGVPSASQTVTITETAPGVFFIREFNRGIVQNQDYSLNTSTNPAPRGSVLIAYLTGQGAVSPAVSSGHAAPAGVSSATVGRASASIGGVSAPVLFLGLTPGLVGVAQANILVPDQAPVGDRTLQISIDGSRANDTVVSIR